MGVFQRFERRLEGLVTGTFARVFRSAVQPVEIAAALQRELDNSAQILSRHSSLVPNDFAVELSPTDYERLAPYAEKLNEELAEVVNNHAATQNYAFTGPVSVVFEQRDGLPTGRFQIRSSAVAGVTARKRSQRPPQPPPDRSAPDATAAWPPASPAPAERFGRAGRPAPPWVEVNGVRHVLEPPGAVLGRATDADLRIADPGVSRRHAEIRVGWDGRRYTASVHDLGSTNATVLNGRRIDQAELEDGAQILLGNTTLVVRFPDGASGREGRS